MKNFSIGLILLILFILASSIANGADFSPAACPSGALINSATDKCESYKIEKSQRTAGHINICTNNLCTKFTNTLKNNSALTCHSGELISADTCLVTIKSTPSCPVGRRYSSLLSGCI